MRRERHWTQEPRIISVRYSITAYAALECFMSIGTILLIVLILLLLAAFPAWPYSRSWGYYPSGFLGALLLIVIVLLLLGVFPKTA
jgi:hypothetical protein